MFTSTYPDINKESGIFLALTSTLVGIVLTLVEPIFNFINQGLSSPTLDQSISRYLIAAAFFLIVIFGPLGMYAKSKSAIKLYGALNLDNPGRLVI